MTVTRSIETATEQASHILPRHTPLHLGEGPLPLEPADDPTDPLMIRDLPMDLRPRERLIYAGAGALSTAELLAIILRVGGRGENVIRMAERLLSTFGGVAGLAQASFDELRATHGVGEAKAAQIKAALELGKRLLLASPQERLQIRSPTDVANLLMMEMGLLEQEQLRVVLLDTKNYVLRVHTVYSGSLNTAVVRVGEVFREAIRANCAGVILAHNHPSGDPTPSPEDVRVTEAIVEAGALLDIRVLDHLIIGRNRFISLKERRLGFKE
jgi:DNA repair protein RadC